MLEVGVQASADGQPFSRLCSVPVPPRQDPTHPRMPGVRVRVPPPRFLGAHTQDRGCRHPSFMLAVTVF